MKMIIKLVFIAAVVWISSKYLSGVHVDGYQAALIATIVLSVINVLVKPILQIISLPITIITLGLFCFVINALMVMLMDNFVSGFSVTSFWWALLISLIVSASSSFIEKNTSRMRGNHKEVNP